MCGSDQDIWGQCVCVCEVDMCLMGIDNAEGMYLVCLLIYILAPSKVTSE